MPASIKTETQLDLRLPAELKAVIEAAAAHLGQSAAEYAVLTLVQNARSVLQQHNVTELSNHDRGIFLAMLDDVDARPNKALKDAAKKYRKHFGR